jgi:polar amino acid transport system substrate-binding protein
MSARLAVALWALITVGCDLPRDADGTMHRARGGIIRVGAVHNPPWVDTTTPEVSGVEAALVKDIAQQIGARIEWTRWPESELMTALHERRIDLVAAGLLDSSPWQQEVALTRPYFVEHRGSTTRRHVLATAPGENGWLVHVERTLHARQRDVPALVASASR